MNGLLDLKLESTPFLVAVDVVAAVLLLWLVVTLLSSRRRSRALVVIGVGLSGALLGWGIAWFLSDVANPFGVPLSTPIRLWAAALFAGVSLVVVGFVFLRGRLVLLPALALPLCVLAPAFGINADVGEFPTLQDVLGGPGYRPLASAVAGADGTHGTVGTVTIPGTVSGFPARPAMVYLPPVLATPHPPALPVIEAFSGQPGSPENLFTAGHLAAALDAWAAAHHGIAPIVVVPDQLTAPTKNPMCVDSVLGNSATYLTVDVPRWIRAHYRVVPSASGWAIAGFSQGGTCAIQLGAAHPELYGTVFDISGEERPGSGSPARAVQSAFGGSRAAYDAAAPAAVLAAHAPYRQLRVIFVAGADDARYLAAARTVAAAATKAGANVRLIVSPGTGHDWHTVRYAFHDVLPLVVHDIGLR